MSTHTFLSFSISPRHGFELYPIISLKLRMIAGLSLFEMDTDKVMTIYNTKCINR